MPIPDDKEKVKQKKTIGRKRKTTAVAKRNSDQREGGSATLHSQDTSKNSNAAPETHELTNLSLHFAFSFQI